MSVPTVFDVRLRPWKPPLSGSPLLNPIVGCEICAKDSSGPRENEYLSEEPAFCDWDGLFLKGSLDELVVGRVKWARESCDSRPLYEEKGIDISDLEKRPKVSVWEAVHQNQITWNRRVH